ncbi:MAG: hypothetical protein PHE17_01335 [Thiothrix sp.]|uniref:hypothetical protein n=1 Tax=Thiothrix sp. TaxID=1032 RepID=UPI0026103F16|nr:hypothetical protein [Thiothrix sp.]MDD5391639.1 hypothetical protein [Thiothrix sp.]
MKKLILGLALGLVSTQPVFAACAASNLAGTWIILGGTNNNFQGVAKGTVVISSTGVVDATKSSIGFVVPTSTGLGTFSTKLTGKLSVNTTCAVSGTLTTAKTSYIDYAVYTISGQMDNSDKNTISSIYRTSTYDIGMINWVKQ